VSLCLIQQAMAPPPIVVVQRKTAEVIEDGGPFSAVNLQVLLGHAGVAISQIVDCAYRAIRHTERDGKCVAIRLSRIEDSLGKNPPWNGARQITDRVDKVAHLAEDAAASFHRVVYPTVGRRLTRVDAVCDEERLIGSGKEIFDPPHQGRKAPVITHHQASIGAATVCFNDVQKRRLVESEGLLNEYGLARAESRRRKPGMLIMTSSNQYCVN
jgi:hypothetical protein